MTTVPRCFGCARLQPDWPAGWLALDDGRHYCPACRTNVHLLRARRAQLGDDPDDAITEAVVRALRVDDDQDDDA